MTSLLEGGDEVEKGVSGDVAELGGVVGETPLVKNGEVMVDGDEPMRVLLSVEDGAGTFSTNFCLRSGITVTLVLR